MAHAPGRPRGRRLALATLLAFTSFAFGQTASVLVEPDWIVRPDATLELLSPDGSVPIARISVEIAAEPTSWARGLMGRALPDDDQGMLFVYPDSRPRAFWMRNTPATLDILFADADRRVTHIVREAQPMSDKHLGSNGPASYVIEVRGGYAERHGVVKGLQFRIFRGP